MSVPSAPAPVRVLSDRHPLHGRRLAPTGPADRLRLKLAAHLAEATRRLEPLHLPAHTDMYTEQGEAAAMPGALRPALRYKPNMHEITLTECARQVDPNNTNPLLRLIARLAAWLHEGHDGELADWLASENGPFPRHEAEWLVMAGVDVPDRLKPWPT